MSLVDSSFHPGAHSYTYVEVHHIGGEIVRIEIRRDSYAQQSWACAQVLASDRSWSPLAAAPTAEWHHRTGHPQRVRQLPPLLAQLALGLRERARRILAAAPDQEAGGR